MKVLLLSKLLHIFPILHELLITLRKERLNCFQLSQALQHLQEKQEKKFLNLLNYGRKAVSSAGMVEKLEGPIKSLGCACL